MEDYFMLIMNLLVLVAVEEVIRRIKSDRRLTVPVPKKRPRHRSQPIQRRRRRPQKQKGKTKQYND